MGKVEHVLRQGRLVSATKNSFSCATRTSPIWGVSSVNDFDGDPEKKANMEESFEGSLRAGAQLESNGLSAIKCGQAGSDVEAGALETRSCMEGQVQSVSTVEYKENVLTKDADLGHLVDDAMSWPRDRGFVEVVQATDIVGMGLVADELFDTNYSGVISCNDILEDIVKKVPRSTILCIGSKSDAAHNECGQAKGKSSWVDSIEKVLADRAGEYTPASSAQHTAPGSVINSQAATSLMQGEGNVAGAHSNESYEVTDNGNDKETLGGVGLHDPHQFHLRSLEKSTEDSEWVAELAGNQTIEDREAHSLSVYLMRLNKGEWCGSVGHEAEAARSWRGREDIASLLENVKTKTMAISMPSAQQSDREKREIHPVGQERAAAVTSCDVQDVESISQICDATKVECVSQSVAESVGDCCDQATGESCRFRLYEGQGYETVFIKLGKYVHDCVVRGNVGATVGDYLAATISLELLHMNSVVLGRGALALAGVKLGSRKHTGVRHQFGIDWNRPCSLAIYESSAGQF